MKPHAPDRTVEVHLPNEIRSFQIKANGKAFQTMVAALYSNKIAAVLREIGSNAFDAHVAAGVPDKPFEVWLPGALSPVMRIRDFGTGMDHETIMTLYSTLFESSKEDTNDQVGFLGLGSKSPFAYTDAFTVSAYDGKIKRQYGCFLDPERVPQISLLNSAECDEPRGFEVAVTVKREDHTEFRQKAETIFSAFAVRPTIDGKISEPEEVFDQGTGWKIVNSDNSYYIANVKVQQGCVRYALDLQYADKDIRLVAGSGKALIIEAPIGSCSVTPSRESLSYDSPTISFIKNQTSSVVSEITERIRVEFDKIKNLPQLERAHATQKLIGSFNSSFIPSDAYSFLKLKIAKNTLRSYHPRYGFTQYIEEIALGELQNFQVMYLPNPIPRGYTTRVNRFLGGSKGWSSRYIKVVHTYRDLRRVVRVLGLKPEQVVSYTSCPAIERTPRVPRDKSSKNDPLSKFYTMDGTRLKLSEVPSEYRWVTKAYSGCFNARGFQVSHYSSLDQAREMMDENGLEDIPLLYVTTAGASGSPSAGKGDLNPDWEFDARSMSAYIIPYMENNAKYDAILSGTLYQARYPLENVISKEIGPRMEVPGGFYLAQRFCQVDPNKLINKFHSLADQYKSKYPLCYTIDSEKYVQYIDSINTHKEND